MLAERISTAILILDLGGQYCHMIKRSLVDLGIDCDIVSVSPEVVTIDPRLVSEYGGIILSGGPQSVHDVGAPRINPALLSLNVPILGICYGHQLLAQMLGGIVGGAQELSEFGAAQLTVTAVDPLLEETPETQTVWMSHQDVVHCPPPDCVVTSTTDRCTVASFRHQEKPIFGLQFHPEVSHTEYGSTILQNFMGVCGAKPIEQKQLVTKIVDQIKDFVGDRKVLFFVSGGVDSTVAFFLTAMALHPQQLMAVYVDTGFMRKYETHDILDLFDRLNYRECLEIKDWGRQFHDALMGVYDPEEKRKIIGRTFVEVQGAVLAQYLNDDWILGQGTIYPDVIESGPGAAAKIKTHHNQCAEVQELVRQGRVLEPLRDLYKDQVRQIGRQLGIPQRFVDRWPFPGPGLAIRCLCATEDAIVNPLPPYMGLHGGYECIRVPLRSVGVQGDTRTYRTTMAVRGPLNKRDLIALTREYSEDRVIVHLAGNVDLNTGRVVASMMTQSRINTLREADQIVQAAMNGKEHLVWQLPVVLIPLTFGRGESIVLRPIQSRDAMTADFVLLPNSVLNRITHRIMALFEVDAVFLDVSSKPPSTIEWE